MPAFFLDWLEEYVMPLQKGSQGLIIETLFLSRKMSQAYLLSAVQ